MYEIVLLTIIGIYSIATLGLNITMGYAGQVNIGQAAFLGIGAFTSAILTTNYGFPFWLSLPIAGIIAMLSGIALGLISTRLRQDFLAITTIGFNFIMTSVFLYYPIFGGSFGIIGIPRPILFGKEVDDTIYLIIVLIVLALCIIFNILIEKSWLGVAFQCIKQDEYTSESININVRKYKILAFSIGTAYAGLAGALLAHYKTYIVYSDFTFIVSIQILTMAVLGGLGNIYGPIIGTSIVILLPEFFRPLLQYRIIMYVVLLIIILRFQPQGIIGKGSYLEKQIMKMIRGK